MTRDPSPFARRSLTPLTPLTRSLEVGPSVGWLLILLVVLAAVVQVGCSSTTLSDADRTRLESQWELYKVADPAWDAARDRWYDRGGEARTLLIDLLAREMLRQSLERGWQRPQRELLLLPAETTVDRLVHFARQINDPALLNIMADTLSGFAAVDPVIEALSNPQDGDSKLFRLYAMRALVRSGGSRALQHVESTLRDAVAWEERASAADALAAARLSDRPAAARALAGAVGSERDSSVVRRSLAALRGLGQPSAAPAAARLIQSDSWCATDMLIRNEAIQTLRVLTGRKIDGDDPLQWRLAADSVAGRG